MEACKVYALMKKAVRLQETDFRKHVETYILSHLMEDLSYPVVCEAFGMSKSKFYEVFKEQFGCTLAFYIRQVRLEESRRLLRETSFTTTEIAEMSGFSDYNYFCRCFKKDAGMPAKVYRQKTES